MSSVFQPATLHTLPFGQICKVAEKAGLYAEDACDTYLIRHEQSSLGSAMSFMTYRCPDNNQYDIPDSHATV